MKKVSLALTCTFLLSLYSCGQSKPGRESNQSKFFDIMGVWEGPCVDQNFSKEQSVVQSKKQLLTITKDRVDISEIFYEKTACKEESLAMRLDSQLSYELKEILADEPNKRKIVTTEINKTAIISRDSFLGPPWFGQSAWELNKEKKVTAATQSSELNLLSIHDKIIEVNFNKMSFKEEGSLESKTSLSFTRIQSDAP